MRNFFDNPLLLIVLLLIIVLVFGSKRLPDAARSIGRSMRIFKTEVKEMKDEDQARDASRPGSAPLEGRIVDDRPGSEPGRGDPRTDPAARTDEPRRGA